MSTENKLNGSNTQEEANFEVVPPKYHLPGLGGSSLSLDGFSRLLVIALTEAKQVASKCAEDPELQDEYQIFNRKALELEEELKNYSRTDTDLNG